MAQTSCGGDYWKELLARIRDIRSSEKMMHRQVSDLYATSVDYNPKSSESIAFLLSLFIAAIRLISSSVKEKSQMLASSMMCFSLELPGIAILPACKCAVCYANYLSPVADPACLTAVKAWLQSLTLTCIISDKCLFSMGNEKCNVV